MVFSILYRNEFDRENANVQRKLFWMEWGKKLVAAISHIGVVASMLWNAGTGFFR